MSEAYVRMGLFDCRLWLDENRIEVATAQGQKLIMSLDEFTRYIHRDELIRVQSAICSLEEQRLKNSTVSIEFRSKLLTGSYRWYNLRIDCTAKAELTAVMIDACSYNPENSRVEVMGINVDITQFKETQQELVNVSHQVEQLEEQRTLISSNLSASFMLLDMDYRVVWSTESMNPLCGKHKFAHGELCYNSAFQRGVPCDGCPVGVVKATQSASSVIMERDGRQIKVLAEPVYEDAGVVSGAIIKIDDVTDIMYTERRVKELTQVMETVLAYTPVCIFIKDPNNDFRYLYWNKTMAQAVGVATEDAVGKTDAEIFVDVMDVDHFRVDDVKLLEGGVTMEFEESFLNTDGELRTTFTVKTLIPTEYEHPWIMGVAIDVTSKKQQELELIKAKEKAEDSDRFKSSFIANISHEIKTPLNSIIGFSELLSDQTLDEDEREEYLEIIKKNNQLLLQLVADILDLSRIEARIMDFTFEMVDVNLICARTALSSAMREEAKVPIVVKKDMPQYYVCSDENRTQQIITNFVTNAMKFTKQGSIEIGMNLVSDDELEIYVQDTGMGIDEYKLSAVFDRFVKLNSNIQGTGLGLAICSNLVEQMGGRIGVESKVGVGSKFWFTLPIYKD